MPRHPESQKVLHSLWVDEQVWEYLKAQAKGYETRNATIRRLIGLTPPETKPRPRKENQP